MSSSFFSFTISALAALAVAGCSNDGPASATAAPVPGDLGPAPGTGTGTAPAGDELLGPRADDPPGAARPKRASSKVDPKDNPLKPDPSKMDPTTFVPKEYCLMPKLSLCSAYGEKYERLSAVQQFCNSLGGEKAASCPETSRVARCMTPANVMTSYYSSGEKPYTKESAEQKCNDKQWMVLP
jgi:hypothetical protein